jgi:hypothetical protein
MARFIKTDRGDLNLDDVGKGTRNSETGELVLSAGHGEQMGTSVSDTADLSVLTAPVIPARPGSMMAVLRVEAKDGKRPTQGDVKVEQSEVIAWRINGHEVSPVFVPGAAPSDDGYEFYVADGKYRSIDTGRVFDNVGEAQKWVLEQEKGSGDSAASE